MIVSLLCWPCWPPLALGLLSLMAWLSARSTVYTLTTGAWSCASASC
jgi:hypothetical protein